MLDKLKAYYEKYPKRVYIAAGFVVAVIVLVSLMGDYSMDVYRDVMGR